MGNLKCKILFPLGTSGTEPKPLPTDKYEWDGVTNIVELLPETTMHPALYGHWLTSDVYTEEHLFDSTFRVSSSADEQTINEKTDITILDSILPSGTYTYGNSYTHDFAVIVIPSAYTVNGHTVNKGTYMTKVNELYTSEIAVYSPLVIKSITITENGVKRAPDAVAYDEIRTNVPVPSLYSLNVTRNGTYETSSGMAYNVVKVNVPTYELTSERITENGSYSPPAGKAFGYVLVDVPTPTLETLSVSENGEYNAPTGKAYNKVNVDVQGGDIAPFEKVYSFTPTSKTNEVSVPYDIPNNALILVKCKVFPEAETDDYSMVSYFLYILNGSFNRGVSAIRGKNSGMATGALNYAHSSKKITDSYGKFYPQYTYDIFVYDLGV